MSLAPSSHLGPYEIVAPLGAGGMGEVYRARDTRLDRDVAVKILPVHLSRNPEFQQRFEREAKSISQLTHAHICTLYDVGHDNGIDYLVMELLEGQTLAQQLGKGPLPLEQVLKTGVEVASALDAAHRKGVVHRDLKPGNIMLTKSGAKLLDFGLAKSPGVLESDPSAVTITQPLTSKGTLLGTFQYMAPEQLEGMEADARTDIFALGAVLYEIATGKRAFEGASRASLIASIMSSQPRPMSELQPMTPAALDRLIRKCLAKDPESRWQSAADVADELRWITEGGSQIGIRAVARSRKTTGFWLGWGVAALIVVMVAGKGMLPHASAPLKPLHVSVTLPGTEVIDAGLENLAIALSPDGQSLAYCARNPVGINLYLRRLDQREATKIPGTEGAYDPFFSPDGEWIGFFAGEKMRKVSVRGGVSIPLADSIDSRSGIWVDDKTIVYAPHFATPLMRASAAGGAPQPFTALDSQKRDRSHRWPDLLPGGEWVLFTVGTVDNPGAYDECTIEAASLNTGERRTLVNGARMARYVPPGYLVFAQHEVLFAAPIDARDPKPVLAPVPVMDGVGGIDTSGASHFTVSSNGTLAYLPGTINEVYELVWVDRKGEFEPIGAPSRPFELVRVSPDGMQLLLSVGRDTSNRDIWQFDVARGTLARLTFDQKSVTPHWTPDQKYIAYRSEAGQYQIKIQPLDGIEPPRIIHSGPDPVNISSVTPDGLNVLFDKYGSVRQDAMTVPIDGSAAARALWEEHGAQYDGIVSPNGRLLAYVDQDTRAPEVYVRSMSQGGKRQVSIDGGRFPVWSHDGKELFFVHDNAMMMVSMDTTATQLTFGAPQKLFDIPPDFVIRRDVRSFDITPDGKRFVFLRSTTPGTGRRQINIVLNWSEELKSKVPMGRHP